MLERNEERISLTVTRIENLANLKGSGTYTLIIFVPIKRQISVSRMGYHEFARGYYIYTGSALGKGPTSLYNRILRHLNREKKKKWHIDYLLSEGNATVTTVIAAHTKNRMECEINQYLREKLQAKVPVPGFGSSDCKEGCESHLLYFGRRDPVKDIGKLYSEKIAAKIYVLDLFGGINCLLKGSN